MTIERENLCRSDYRMPPKEPICHRAYEFPKFGEIIFGAPWNVHNYDFPEITVLMSSIIEKKLTVNFLEM